MHGSKKILFLVPYPLHEAPSQRFRFEQYFSTLKKNGFHYQVQSFLGQKNWRIFYSRGKILPKLAVLLQGFCKRFAILFQVPSYDFVFIHREVTPLGPPIIEWVISKILRKKIIYDFDDAIWMTDNANESFIVRLLRSRSKVRLICTWSYKISCGNQFLCEFAEQFNPHVIYNPTTIDTDNVHNPQQVKSSQNDLITIGWTGSHSTIKYLREIEHVLAKLEEDFPQIKVVVIADKAPGLHLKSLQFIPWNLNTESQDLAIIEIGIMPLPDDMWAKGKCGFKALQYMAMQIPAVVSNVGVNSSIIDHGTNGFLVSTEKEWYDAICALIKDPLLRKKMGEAGRKKVSHHYSVASNTSNFLSLFL
jgi:glycosyltransferase involved in cell wall biosynthesis